MGAPAPSCEPGGSCGRAGGKAGAGAGCGDRGEPKLLRCWVLARLGLGRCCLCSVPGGELMPCEALPWLRCECAALGAPWPFGLFRSDSSMVDRVHSYFVVVESQTGLGGKGP